MGRGERDDTDELELPATAVPLRPISFNDLRWDELSVSMLAHDRRAEGRTTRLGMHLSGFGMYLTLDALDLTVPFIGPICGSDASQVLCPGPFPCPHQSLYTQLQAYEDPDGEASLQLHTLRTRQQIPEGIETYGLATTDQVGWRFRIARLDANSYFADVVGIDGTPAISCLIDHGVCRFHTVRWKGAGCIGRFLALSWTAPQLTPLLETETEYDALVPGLTLPDAPYLSPRSRARSLFSLGEPVGANESPLLVRTSEQLLLHPQNGALPIELLALREAQCLLCRVGPGPGVPLPCARHPGLARLHASLTDTTPLR